MRAMPLVPSEWSGRPVWAEIDLDALAHNVRLLVAKAAPARVYAVVKANAYGHRAVVAVDEGEELRRAGLDAPILVVGQTPASDAERVVALSLRPAVGAMDLV